MPTIEDYKGMHRDAITLMNSIEEISAIAKRMANFSGEHLASVAEEKDDDTETQDKPKEIKGDPFKKMLILKLKKG